MARVLLEADAAQELFLNMIDYGAMQRKDRAKKEEEIAHLQAEAQLYFTAHADVNEQLMVERSKHEEVQAQLDSIHAQLDFNQAQQAKKEKLLVEVQAELLETKAELSSERILASKAGKVLDLERQVAGMEKMSDLKTQLEKVTVERDELLEEKKARIQQSKSGQPQVPQQSAKGWKPVFELPILKARQPYPT